MVHFIVGLALGGAIGFLWAALLRVSKVEEEYEDWEGEE